MQITSTITERAEVKPTIFVKWSSLCDFILSSGEFFWLHMCSEQTTRNVVSLKFSTFPLPLTMSFQHFHLCFQLIQELSSTQYHLQCVWYWALTVVHSQGENGFLELFWVKQSYVNSWQFYPEDLMAVWNRQEYNYPIKLLLIVKLLPLNQID